MSLPSKILAAIVIVCILNLLLFVQKFADPQDFAPSNSCHVPHWNRIETKSISGSYVNSFSRWLWMSLDLSRESNQNYTEISMMGAYVYPDHISVTISAQYMVKQKVYCRYLDCKKVEIPGSSFESVVFPESVVHCPRRIGAEFMSVSRNYSDSMAEPTRLKFRAFEEPVHDFAVCVAPLYGNESKWLQIVEFIEHHKMNGATFFYFHIGNVSQYDRRVLDYYENKGDIELKVLSEKYERPFYAWQLIEIQDCHLRAKFHAKFVAFIDIDERIFTPSGQRFLELIKQKDNGKTAEIQLPIVNFVKDRDSPEVYLNREQVEKEMWEVQFTKAGDPTWDAPKAVVRPEKVGIMSIHYVVAKESGFETMRMNSTEAFVRHYRATQHRSDASIWDINSKKFTEIPLEPNFKSNLTEKVVKNLRNIFEKVPVDCSSIPEFMWKSRMFPNPCEKMLITW